MVRPANFPDGTPGAGMRMLTINRCRVAVMNLQGRVFLPAINDPFRTADRLVEEARKKSHRSFLSIFTAKQQRKTGDGLVP
ncbi:YmdB family metallophosphoesterase [Terrilactibacillus sp. S3-3]|nr:YmdB family metallophosphoesterase [Terrilactibacillus sp. S3-3]